VTQAGASWPQARRSLAGLVRGRMTTTPGRLRLLGLTIVAAAILAAGVMAAAAAARHAASAAAASQTEPLMVQAEGLYASLSDADATAARTFLIGGAEPAGLRGRYLADLRSASLELATLARRIGGSSEALALVASELPIYSGLVETARANNRQGFPVGAAYLRQASAVMRSQMLPAAGRVYELEAQRLGSDYRSGTASGDLVALVGGAAVLLGLLVLTQLFLTRRTHRVFNVPLAVSTVVLIALGTWAILGMVAEQNALAAAQRQGSDSVQVLAAARILALRAEADDSLALVGRGGSPEDLQDFEVVARVLAPPGGVLGDAATLARRSQTEAATNRLTATFARYRAVHQQIAARETNGDFPGAEALAVGPDATEAPLADRLNSGFVTATATAQRRFAGSARDATSALGGLWLAIPLLVAVSAVLALFGVQARANEYR
jgi:hypothetical protein